MARTHILQLKRYGLGSKAIGEACDSSPATIRLIRQGKLRTILKSTEERIINVTPEAIADGALVSAGNTKAMLKKLLTEGFTWREVSRGLHRTTLQMMYTKRVTARTELRVQKLYRAVLADASILRADNAQSR